VTTLTIDVTDGITPSLNRLDGALAPAEVNDSIGTAVKKLFQDHFLQLPPNKAGFPTTNFWPRAARATTYQVLNDGVVIRVDQTGVRQRLLGGAILPGDGKTYLTIPATGAAYGHRAGEFNLKFAIVADDSGFLRPALVAIRSVASQITRTRTGKYKHTADDLGEVVFYWLVRQVNQKPDSKVIPSQQEITTTATSTVEGIVIRATRKGGSQ
jgi:hypothetical protein